VREAETKMEGEIVAAFIVSRPLPVKKLFAAAGPIATATKKMGAALFWTAPAIVGRDFGVHRERCL